MEKELYFDINSEQNGGSLYRIKNVAGNFSFLYQHSIWNDELDEIKVFETAYPSFTAFWQMIIRDTHWFYQHPLYVHPEQRSFITKQLEQADWSVHPDKKWQESHQRQWRKVLTDRNDYYRSI